MMTQKLFLSILFFTAGSTGPLMAQGILKTIHLKIRIIEEKSRQITPAMVCITGEDGMVRVPPNGEILDSPSATIVFYSGIEFKKNKNWVGPVRKTNGMANENEENRSTQYGLLPSIPYWKEPVMYQTSGDFTISLPAGKWRIAIEHGNEYVPIREEFELQKNEKEKEKTFQLKRWINLPLMGWYSGDDHVHHPTNLRQFRDYLIEYARAEDIHMVNVLEMGHHMGTEFKQAGYGKRFRICKKDICLVSGQEDPRSSYGHVIGLNINHLTRDTSVYNYYDTVFNMLHMQPGAVVGYAHFAINGSKLARGFPMYITTGQIDFVELLQFSRINTLDYYDYLNLGFRITAAAGSDVPWGSTLGEVRTFVYTGKKFSADNWFLGLKSGHTFVSNGPALLLEVDGKIPGTEIMKTSGSKSVIKLKAISNPAIGIINRLAIYNNDGVLIEKANKEKTDSVEINTDHILNKSQWIAAVAYCDNGAVAQTTPVYIIVDGHPTWDAVKGQDIVRKQIELIHKTEDEEIRRTPVDQGIIKRLKKGLEFYSNLLSAMKQEAAERKTQH
jgi:hypothetical protein